MKIISINELPSILENISAKRVYTDNNIEIIQIDLLPNEIIPTHKNKDTALFNIIIGKGIVTVNNKKYNVESGDFIEIEKDIDREWINSGDSLLKITVTKLLS